MRKRNKNVDLKMTVTTVLSLVFISVYFYPQYFHTKRPFLKIFMLIVHLHHETVSEKPFAMFFLPRSMQIVNFQEKNTKV